MKQGPVDDWWTMKRWRLTCRWNQVEGEEWNWEMEGNGRSVAADKRHKEPDGGREDEGGVTRKCRCWFSKQATNAGVSVG